MRNLKKVLSLALALVMLLGMMMVGAGAADTGFEDDAQISGNFKTAAAVTKALGIMEGDGTNLKPTTNITRAEAFILSLRVDGSNANEIAKKWPVNEKPFNDVSTGKWYASYMAYGKEMGLINGSNGNYRPDEEITVVDYSVLLLGKLGFGEYTGANYTKAAKDAQDAGLYESLGSINYYTHKLTREEACQMVFNAINYSPSGASKEYVVKSADGSEVLYRGTNETLAMAAMLGTDGAKMEEVTVAADDSLAKSVFKLDSSTTEDALGRPVVQWTKNGDKLCVTDSTDAPAVTYTKGGVTADDVKKATGASSGAVDGTKIFINGVAQSAGNQDVHSLCANGKTVEVYASNKTITKVVVIAPTVATVSADPVTRTNKDKEEVRIPGIVGAWTETKKVSGWDGLAKGDVVLYVKDKDGKYTIEKAETVTGTLQAKHATKGLQIGDVWYPVSALTGASAASTYTDFKDEYDFYLDAAGNVIQSKKADGSSSTESSYAVVQSVAWFPGTGFTPDGYMQAKILKTDGTYETVTVTSVDGVVPVREGKELATATEKGKVFTAEKDALSAATASTQTLVEIRKDDNSAYAGGAKRVTEQGKYLLVGEKASITVNDTYDKYYGVKETNDLTDAAAGFIVLDQFYAYTVDSDGNYALTNVTGGTALAGNITKGAAKFDTTTVGNANTVFLFTDKDGKNVQIYTGINDVPSATVGTDDRSGNRIVKKSNIAQFVYVKNGVVSNTSNDVVYVADATVTTTSAGNQYDVFVNGEPGTVVVANNVTLAAGNLYTVSSVNDKGVSTLTNISGFDTSIGIKVNAGGVMETLQDACATAGKKIFTTNDETVVFVIEGDNDKATCTQMTASSIEADSNDKVWVILAPGTTTDLAGTIYVKKEAIARPTLSLQDGTDGGVGSDKITGFTTASPDKATVKVDTGKTDIKFAKPTMSPAQYEVTVAYSGTAVETPSTDYNGSADITLKIPAGTKAANDLTLTITVTIKDNNNENIIEVFTYTVTVKKDA